MRKKLLALVLAGITGVGLLAGCGSSDKSSENTQESEETVESSTETQAEEDIAQEDTETDALKAASEAEIDGELVISIGDHQTDQYIWKIASAKGFLKKSSMRIIFLWKSRRSAAARRCLRQLRQEAFSLVSEDWIRSSIILPAELIFPVLQNLP